MLTKKRKKSVTWITYEELPGSWRTECQCQACAVYKCCECGHTWRARPNRMPCPNCGHHRFVWVNYVDWCKVHGPK